MLKVKVAVTAAILLVAVGAFASNFRVADQVYVPAVGHIVGGSQLFISDVFIDSILGNHFLEQEKERMLLRHADTIRNVELDPFFDLFPPSVNSNLAV